MNTLTEHGILFSAPMVLAILNTKPGTWPAEPIDPKLSWKWQTRRAVNPQPRYPIVQGTDDQFYENAGCGSILIKAPHGPAGRFLWVRETWKPHCEGPISDEFPLGTCVKYRADGKCIKPTDWTNDEGAWCEAQEESTIWRPSLLMPRWASRITLEVKRVRAQRVHDITEEDCLAEGIGKTECAGGTFFLGAPQRIKGTTNIFPCAKDAYQDLWTHINGVDSWVANPWVWIYDFMRVK
jgi:hypothetical protein